MARGHRKGFAAARPVVALATGALIATIFALWIFGAAPYLAYPSLAVIFLGLLQLPDVDGAATTLLPWAFCALAVFNWRQSQGEAPSAEMLAAAALGLQLRLWLLRLASLRGEERAALADQIGDARQERASVFVDQDIESDVSAGTLREGHIVRVAPGQILPVDGFVTFGSGFVREGFLDDATTRLKGMGSPVFAGSRNENGSLLVRTSAVGAQTLIAKLAAALRRKRLPLWVFPPDLAALAVAAAFYLSHGSPALLAALLASPSAGLFAAFTAFHFSLARASAARLWLWAPRGIFRLGRAGVLVSSAPGVLSEGRPKLAAAETLPLLSEDAALGLLGPVARKLETPAAFAVLLELRARNIPLQLADFYEPREGGGLAMVGGEEIRWITLDSARRETPPLGDLEIFVREHENAGDEVCLLERQGTVQAALAFRDAPVKGAALAVEELQGAGYPVLLVSPLPKRCTARLQTEFGLEHAQGESGDWETEALVSRLADEKLTPAWLQTQAFRPTRAAAVVAQASAAAQADLLVPSTSLPDVAEALAFGKQARSRLRFALGVVASMQTGLLLALLTADPAVAATFHLGAGWTVNPLAVALLGSLPGFAAFFFAHSRLGSPAAV